jgi:hypothetical protein
MAVTNPTRTIAATLSSLITLPIWIYLMWWMLTASGAGDLQMFLFWVYVPVTLLVRILFEVTGKAVSS